MNNRKHNTGTFKILMALFLILAFTSCRSKKSLEKIHLPKQDAAALFYDNLETRTLSSQLQINTGGLSGKGDLRIIKDRAIYLSFQAFLGIEVARIKITPDSLIAIDRFNRRYLAESFKRLKELSGKGINYNALQSLFTNRLFLNGQDKLTMNDMDEFIWKSKGDETLLIPKKDPNCTFLLNDKRQLKETVLTDSNDQFKMDWSYSRFEEDNQTVFPHFMEINISTPKRRMSGSIQFARIEFGKDLNVDCVIPSRYTRVELDDIFKIFSDL